MGGFSIGDFPTSTISGVAKYSVTALYEARVKEIEDGTFEELLQDLMQKPISEMKELYNTREIEK